MRSSLSSLAIIFLLACGTGLAQSFSLSTSPRRQSFQAGGSATFTVTIVPTGGFSATVNLAVLAPTVPYVALNVSAKTLNAPYTGGLKITVDRKSSNMPASHMIVVHGWNGALHAYDTCYLDVPSVRGWEYYNASNSPLPSNVIRAIAIDREGAGWIATQKGLARFDGHNWTTYTRNDFGGTDDDIIAIAVDSLNAIWIGPAAGGLARFKNGAWTSWGMGSSHDTILHPSDSARPDTVHHSTPAETPSRSLAAAPNGDVWASRGGRLWKFDGAGWTSYTDQPVGTIVVDHDNVVWSSGSGITKFDGTFWSTGMFGVSGGGPRLMIDRGNDIWGTGGGCVRYDRATASGTQVFGRYACCVDFDTMGTLWIGSSNGTGDFSFGEGLFRLEGTVATQYDVFNSGLPDNRVINVKVGANRTIWMQTLAPGLVLFNPEIAAGVADENATTGTASLSAIAPNPTANDASARVRLARRSDVRLTLHDALGRIAAVVFDGTLDAGERALTIHTAGLASGAYMLRLAANGTIETRTLVVRH